MNSDTVLHVKPSQFVRRTRIFKQWCTVTVCTKCGLRAKYEDCHPVNPCPNCGSLMMETVGRWVTTVEPMFFGLLRAEQGVWVLRDEYIDEICGESEYSDKAKNFLIALVNLCIVHHVQLSPSGYDSIQIWDLKAGDQAIHSTAIEDCTVQDDQPPH